MKIPLQIDAQNRLGFPSITIRTSRFFGRIKGIIDTGSNTTFISEGFAIMLKIPYSSLPVYNRTKGIGGEGLVLVKWGKPVALNFLDENNEGCKINLPWMLIGRKETQSEKKRIIAQSIPCIFGMDFLENQGFKLVVDMKNREAYLEKDDE